MEPLTAIELDILKMTAVAPTDLERLYIRNRLPPLAASLAQTGETVESLVRRGLIAPECQEGRRDRTEADPNCIWRATFVPTALGSEVLAAIPPPVPDGGRIYRGMLKNPDYPSLSFEEFAEARREMWSGMGRNSGE